MSPIMTPVTSSNIESVGYIAENQELFVKFKNCKTFCYKDVSALEAGELTKSVSVGRHFNQYIKAIKVGSEVATIVEPIRSPMTDKEKIDLLRAALRHSNDEAKALATMHNIAWGQLSSISHAESALAATEPK